MIYLTLIIALIAFLERTVFDLGPNVELITLTLILASFTGQKKFALLLTFTVIALSDLVIGNSNIALFTWSGFLLPTLVLPRLFKRFKSSFRSPTILATMLGLGSNLFFYLWTNFGVWTLDSWGMYPKTILGLVSCYINAIPFFKNQLESTLLFVPSTFLAIRYLHPLLNRLRIAFLTNQSYNT